MKKIFTISLLILSVTAYALIGYAQQRGMPITSKPSVLTITLLNAVTATGPGTAVDLGSTIYDEFTCQVNWSGTTPTNTVVALDGSVDGVNYGDDHLGTITSTASGEKHHIVDKLIRFIRPNYISKAAGDGTTAVTYICIAKAR